MNNNKRDSLNTEQIHKSRVAKTKQILLKILNAYTSSSSMNLVSRHTFCLNTNFEDVFR